MDFEPTEGSNAEVVYSPNSGTVYVFVATDANSTLAFGGGTNDTLLESKVTTVLSIVFNDTSFSPIPFYTVCISEDPADTM